MHSFVVVGANRGCAIPEGVLSVLREARPTELALAPDDHLLWTDASGRLAFAGWQAAGSNLGVVSRWEVRPTGLTAFSGHVWLRSRPWATDVGWASQLADALAREPLERVAPEIDGVGAVASLSADGAGSVTADPLGVAVLYTARTPEITVVGTRAALVARVAAGAGRRVGRDAEGAGWVAYASSLQTDRTTFEGVRTVPQGSVVRFTPNAAVRVDTWSARPWLDGPSLDGADAVTDAIHASTTAMRNLARLVATLPSSMTTLELTGGRDSRLVLSLLVAEDLARDVVCITWGQPTLPDVVVATEIADRFGLKHDASGRTGSTGSSAAPRTATDRIPAPRIPARGTGHGSGLSAEERYRADLLHHVWLTSGAQSIWDLGAGSRGSPGNTVALTGLFGGELRTSHPRTDGIRSVEHLWSFVRSGKLGFDAAHILRRDVRQHYEQQVLDQLEQMLPEGGTAHDAIDGYQQAARLRRWFGTGHENDHRNRTFPLYSMTAIRTAFGLGSDRRRAEVLPFEVMRRCCDELARMAFAGSQWPALAVAGVDDPGGYPTADPVPAWRPPPAPALRSRVARVRSRVDVPGWRRADLKATTAGEVARMRDLERKIPVLHELADLPPSHRFHDLVDRKALHRAIDQLASRPFLARRAVHDAVTTAIWLSEQEQPDRHEEPPRAPESAGSTAHGGR